MNTQALPSTLLKLFIAAALLVSTLAFTSPAAAQTTTCQTSVTVVRGDTLLKIANRCGTTVSALLRANPDIRDANKISVGQVILLPGALITGSGSTDLYIIKRGDTLNSLARRFNTTVDRLLELNKDITDRNRIYEGQRLQVPNGQTPAPAPGQTYIVQKGDTLNKIAARFNTTVDILLKLNPSIKDANKISVGQKIVLPAGVEIYTVVKNDTLRSIAARFNTTVEKLLQLNPTITDANKIYVGQILRIK